MKKALSVMLALVMAFSTAVIGIQPAKASATDENQTASSVINADGVKPYRENDPLTGNIYGTGETPFLLSEQNELYVFYTDENNIETSYYDNISSKIVSEKDGRSFVNTPNSKNSGGHKGTVQNIQNGSDVYRYVQATAFDPFGSGRKNYAAYVGALATTGNTAEIWCFVVEPKSGKSYALKIGDANWIKSNGDRNNYEMTDFMAITAGDYDGDHKDSIIVYQCGDCDTEGKKGDYKLYEVKFDEKTKTLSKSQIFDLTSVIKNDVYYAGSDIKYKPIVSLTTGDFDGDRKEEFAYSVGFHNTSGSARNGWSGKEVSSMDYFATAVGVGDYTDKAWKYSEPVRMYDKGARESLEGSTEVYPYTIIQGGAISGGDTDGDGMDEIILAGYTSLNVKGTFVSGNLTKVSGPGNLDPSKINTAVINYTGVDNVYTRSEIYSLSLKDFNSSSFDKWKDSYYVYPQIGITCVATNGKNQVEDVFIAGTFYSFKGDGPMEVYSPMLSGQHFNTILDDDKATSCYWFGSVVAGNFDHNEAGREQVYYAAWFKIDSSYKCNAYVGIAGGAQYSDQKDSNGNITKFGSVEKYACSDIRGDYGRYITDKDSGSKVLKEDYGPYSNLAPAAVDIDDDGLLARYSKTGYVYTDPEVVAVLEAAPYFSQIDNAGGYDDPCGTSYSIQTSYEYATSHGDSVSFGVGFAGEVSAGCGKMSLELGYSLEWSQEFEKAYSETSTTTWVAQYEDIVCVKRTPVLIYCYDIYQNGGWIKNGHTIEAPLAPVAYSLSIDEYNEFVDEYNALVKKIVFEKITDKDLPKGHTGNPFAYYNSWDEAGTGAKALSNTSYQLGYAGGFIASEMSQGASESESTSMSHGFSYSLTLQFGGGVGGSGGEAWAGGYVNLDYGHSKGSSTTKGTEKAVSGQVQNIRSSALAGVMSDSDVRQYAFRWELGRWTRNLVASGNAVPFYGFVVTGVTAPLNPPENLSATFTDSKEITSVILEWDAPEAIISGPALKGYYIYDNGEQVNQNLFIPTSTGKVSYIHNGVSYGSKHNYTVRAVSMMNNKEYISAESNEVAIGWITTGNIIERVYKDEAYISESGLVDRYVILMSDGSESAFFVTNGKDGADGTAGVNGIDGKTAYEMAVANGYKGTQTQWLSLIGADCGESHSFIAYTISASCNHTGISVKVCERCGYATAEQTEALKHDYETVTVTPTCTLPGFTTHTCRVCKSSYMTDYTPATGHDYEAKTVSPTCSQKGYTAYACKVCGENHISDITETTPHSFKDKAINNTCISDGYTIHLCESCGYQQITDEKAAKGHDYEVSQVIAPTCISKGYTIYNCKDCGAYLKGDEKDFAAHRAGGWVCENASTGHYVRSCIVCGVITEEKTATVSVTIGEESSVVKQGETISLSYGESILLASQASPARVTCTSSDTSVVNTDKNGVVTAKGNGTATITVTDNETGISTAFNVKVRMTWWQKILEILSSLILFKTLFTIFNIGY